MVKGIVRGLGKMIDKKLLFTSAVIVAAGSASRMGGINKIFYELDGIPVIIRTLSVFQQCREIDEIVLVVQDRDIAYARRICSESGIGKLTKIVPGGQVRCVSSYNGVSAVSEKSDIVIIHDGARPFVTEDMLLNAIDAAVKYSAATAAIPVTSTVKRGENGFVGSTVDRENLFEIQTPQAFKTDIIKGALENAANRGSEITDDCMAAEAIGLHPRLFDGSRANIKITVKEDLDIAHGILKGRENR